MKHAFLYVIIAMLLQSCDYFSFRTNNQIPVARVNGTYLYKNELSYIFTKDISSRDSILLARNFINNWVKQQLLLSKAQLNLEDRTVEFEKLVSKYREDLYINSYKEAVVMQYLNTEISEVDIDDFYEENKQNYKLNEELVQLKYIKIAEDIFNRKELVKLFKSNKIEDLDSLKSKELSLKSHHLNDTVWIKYNDLVTKVPIYKTIERNQLLKKNSFFQKEDSLSLYLLTIKDVLKRNEIAPKSYIKPTIKQMILQQRKLLFLRNIEETLIDDANKKQQFEIY